MNQPELLRALDMVRSDSSDGLRTLGEVDLPTPVIEQLRLLHADVTAARRREATANLLLDAAALIAATTGLESVLAAVCRRARLLFESDMAYVSLNDFTTQETYIRTTDGVNTREYRNLRMPLGTGILGQAAAGETIALTSGYEGDPSFPHHPEADRAVRLEGVESILAATMRVDGQVIGALLIADRYPRKYSTEEASTLERIASIAAVEVQKESHVQQLTTASEQRDAAREKAERRLTELESLYESDTRLIELLRAGGSLEQFEQAISEQLAAPVRISVTGAAGGAGGSGGWTADAGPSHPVTDLDLLEHRCDAFPSERAVMAPVSDGRRILGFVEAEISRDDPRTRLLSRASVIVGTQLVNEELRFQAERQVQDQLLGQLLTSKATEWPQIVRRLQVLGLHEGDLVHVNAIWTPDTAQALRVMQSFVDRRRGIVGEHDGLVFVVSAQVPGEEVDRALTRALGDPPTVAFREIRLARSSLRGALRACRVAVGSMRAMGISGARDAMFGTGFIGLAISQLPPNAIHKLINDTLADLLAYDAAHQTELTDTAWMFLENDGRVAEVARQMHIHENTVRQRVDRIATLVGDGWHRGARGMEFHLMLQLWRITRDAGGGAAGG